MWLAWFASQRDTRCEQPGQCPGRIDQSDSCALEYGYVRISPIDFRVLVCTTYNARHCQISVSGDDSNAETDSADSALELEFNTQRERIWTAAKDGLHFVTMSAIDRREFRIGVISGRSISQV